VRKILDNTRCHGSSVTGFLTGTLTGMVVERASGGQWWVGVRGRVCQGRLGRDSRIPLGIRLGSGSQLYDAFQ
jgi:hypothetical protein